MMMKSGIHPKSIPYSDMDVCNLSLSYTPKEPVSVHCPVNPRSDHKTCVLILYNVLQTIVLLPSTLDGTQANGLEDSNLNSNVPLVWPLKLTFALEFDVLMPIPVPTSMVVGVIL